jgi:outer membrane protein assembly factor BamB
MNAACKPVFGFGLIFLTSGHTKVVLAVKQGGAGILPPESVAWKTNKATPSRPSLLLSGDMLFMVSDQGFVACFDAKSGEQHWQDRLGGDFSSSPILADGRIFVSDQESKTHVLAVGKEFKPLAVNKLDSGCMASPAAVGDAIYLRTKTHLYCIGKK